MSSERQVWINGAAKYCAHDYQEIRSEDGKILYGALCARCSASWALGQCDGCSRPQRRLTHATSSGRYCDSDCAEQARVRTANAARKEVREARPDRRCDHRHTEGVLAEGGHLIGVRCLSCSKSFPGAGP